ncbi:ABC transporter substrate-binding protein [Streptosporangium lutulentum]
MDAVKANVPKSETDVSGTIDKSKVKKSLVVGVDNPYYLFHHDIEVALVKGYFKEFGIDSVEIKTIEDPLPPLIGGSLDLALYDTDTAITAAKKSGQGLRFLSVYLGGEANILGVGKGITSGADLKGKTITGGQFGSRNDAIIRQLLRDNGVEPDRDVKIVSTGGQSNERLQSVIAGTVDGASIQLRHRTVLEKAGGKVLFQETREVPQSGWSANKLLQESPETVTAFLAATLKARQFITDQANKDEVLTIMRDRKFDIPAEYADAYGAENAPDYHVSDGGFKRRTWTSSSVTRSPTRRCPRGRTGASSPTSSRSGARRRLWAFRSTPRSRTCDPMRVETAEAKGLRLLAHHDLDGRGDGMQVMRHENTLYVGHAGTSRAGTSILDVSDPRRPKLVDQWRRRTTRTRTRCRSPTACCWSTTSVFRTGPPPRWDRTRRAWRYTTSPIRWRRDGSRSGSPPARAFTGSWEGGRFAHVSVTPEGFTDRIWMILDLSDPYHPVEAGRWWWPGQWEAGGERPDWLAGRRHAAHHALLDGDIAYLGYDDANLVVLDIADPSAPGRSGSADGRAAPRTRASRCPAVTCSSSPTSSSRTDRARYPAHPPDRRR